MGLGRFLPGTEIYLEGHKYKMERKLESGHWVLHHLSTGRPLERHEDELLKDYADEVLTFTRTNVFGLTGTIRPPTPSAAAIEPRLLNAAARRRLYTQAVLGLPRSKGVYEAAIKQAWLAAGEESKPPNWISVVRWTKSVELSGGSFAGLVENESGKGNRTARTHPDVIACCQWVIERYYLTELRPTLNDALNFAAGEIENENRLRLRSERLTQPSRKLFRRLLALIPDYDKDAARFGRQYAQAKYRTRLHIRLTERPLQRAEADHTRLDILVVDDKTKAPLGRPWLTVVIDDFTRVVLGYALTFDSPSCCSVSKALKSAFKPKFAKDRYPAVENEWFAFGVPVELGIDNGLEFHSYELQQVCLELGCDLDYAPRKTPWFKGKVEKFNATINRGAVTNNPGKTFSNVLEKEDYDPTKHAVLTKNQLEALLNKFFCDVYHQKPHMALGCSPAEMWKSHIQELDVGLVPDFTRFDAILGLRETRVLSHAGIRYEGLFYNSSEMEAIRKRDGTEIEVEIRVDRDDLSSIIVLSPRTKEPIRVECLTPDYAEGLSLWQHKVCKAYAAKNRKEGIDPETVNAWKIAHATICMVAVRLMEEKAQKRRNSLPAAVSRWTDNLEYHLGLTPSRGAIPDATEWRDLPASVQKAEPASNVPQDGPSPSPSTRPTIDAAEPPDARAAALGSAAPSVVPPKANPRQRGREAKATSSSQPVDAQSVEAGRPSAETGETPRRSRKFNAILT